MSPSERAPLHFAALLSEAFEGLRERPSRVVFAPLVFLWAFFLSAIIAVPLAFLSSFLLPANLGFLTVSFCLSGFIGIYFSNRGLYALGLLYASPERFFDAWSDSAPHWSRTLAVAILGMLIFFLGTLALLLPGLVLGGFAGLLLPCLVLEDHDVIGIYKAVWTLLEGWKLRVFLWSASLWLGAIVVILALLCLPAGALLGALFLYGFFVPFHSLFYVALFRALKSKPVPEPMHFWRRLLIVLASGLLGLLLIAGLGYMNRGRLESLFFREVLSSQKFREAFKALRTARGEASAELVLGPLTAVPPAPPFDKAWSGVQPGSLAVDLSGTVLVADDKNLLTAFDYGMAVKLSRSSEVQNVRALSIDASGNAYALGTEASLFRPALQTLGPDLAPAFTWSISADGAAAPAWDGLAVQGSSLWLADTRRSRVALYDLQGQRQKEGHWQDKDPGTTYGLSLAASQTGWLYLLVDRVDVSAGAHPVYRRLYAIDSLPDDPFGEAHVAWDLSLPVQNGDGHGMVAVTWEGIPYVADRRGLQAVPNGAVAHAWPFDLGTSLRGFAIDAWGAAHFLDSKGRLQRISNVAY